MPEQLGRYELLETIGEGGFAIVYKGRDTVLDRPVALKELRPVLLQDKNWVQRFRREARTIARLDHLHIVPIFDVYEASGRLFIVMRLVEDGSLEKIIARQGALSWQNVLDIILPIAEGLDYAHANAVLHRDLKPANILLDAERGPMLSDFGLAKLVGEHSLSLTESGSIVGTPHYIAPEVWEGKGTTKKSDIYALGCILYEMVTGEKIFKGETPPAVMMAHFKPLSLPVTWPDGVPEQISAVLHLALAQDPAERYATAAELLAGIRAIDQSQPLPARPVLAPAQPAEAPAAPPPLEPSPEAPPPAPQESGPPTPPPLSAAQPWPQPTPHSRPRGRGCLTRATFIAAALVLAIVIGLGSFCAAVGGSIGSNVDAPLKAITNMVAQNVQVGDVVTETIRVPIPKGETTPRLEIDVAADNFVLNTGAKDVLVEGQAIYNVAVLKPKIVTNNQNVRLTHQGTTIDLFALMMYDFVRTDIKNNWDLTLGDTPMVLSLSTGTAQGLVNLNNYAIEDMSISQQIAADLDLTFSRPNQIAMKTFEFNSGPTKRARLNGLANTRAQRMNFAFETGEYLLDFSGQLQNDIEANMQGTAGTLTLIVPEGVAATVALGDSVARVDPADSWQSRGRDFVLTNGEHTITIDATNLAVETTLKLRNVE